MSNQHSRSTPSPATIDRDWPFQVALPDDLCVKRNFTLITEFCRANELRCLTRTVTAVWSKTKQERFRLHCFADLASAEAFRDHFGGTLFDPKRDRENGRATGAWYRTDEWTRVLESGPLSVPEVLRS